MLQAVEFCTNLSVHLCIMFNVLIGFVQARREGRGGGVMGASAPLPTSLESPLIVKRISK